MTRPTDVACVRLATTSPPHVLNPAAGQRTIVTDGYREGVGITPPTNPG
jgi:hypothetical protein